MDWLHIAGTIYVIGAVICAFIAFGAVAHETTSHGQDILIGSGCLLVLFWPIVLVWAAIVGIGLLISVLRQGDRW